MAERCGPDFPSVLAQPFALTLYAWLMLQERDRIRRLVDRERDIYRATLNAMAFNEPKHLDSERTTALGDMRAPATAAARQSSADELLAAGESLWKRLEAGRVLVDAAKEN